MSMLVRGAYCKHSFPLTTPVLVHEFNHSYCNLLNEGIWDSIAAKADAIFAENASFYDSIAYGAPELVMNEMFVEASMIRYLMSFIRPCVTSCLYMPKRSTGIDASVRFSYICKPFVAITFGPVII